MEGPDTWTEYDLGSLIPIRDELMEGDLRALYIVWLAAARHSSAGKVVKSSDDEDIAAWVKLLPPDRGNEYLLRLAQNEPGLSRLFLRELSERSKDKTGATPPTGERVTYTTLLPESATVKAQIERESREQEEAAHHRHLQDIHDHQDAYWHQINMAAVRASGTSYDEATRLLTELREAAVHFNETQEFQARFRVWVQPHLRRPAIIKRLQAQKFTLPEM